MNTSSIPAGIPLLSRNKPPEHDGERAETACRRCDKEFNMLFARAKKCNHCGYAYCSNCTDFQALMPRDANTTPGYDPVPVCAYCIGMLNITAANKARLHDMPITRLRAYMKSYNISSRGVVEKDELIERILSARQPNGCLPKEHEDFYRRHSVPEQTTSHSSTTSRARSFFSRTTGVGSNNGEPAQPQNPSARPSPQEAARPPPPPPPPRPTPQPQPQPRHQPYPSYHNSPPQPPPNRPFPQPPPPSSHAGQHAPQFNNTNAPPPPQFHFHSPSAQPPPTPPRETRPPQPTSSRPSPARAMSPAPIPTLDQLLTMSDDEVSRLSIHALKSTLHTNHVNARLVVEKSELIERVKVLINQERQEREQARLRQEEEERELSAALNHAREEEQQRQQRMTDDLKSRSTQSSAAPSPSPPTQFAERSGLCVICQDEDANIAIVDCGHLCLCRSCSETVMSSTRECPMCRTRIVTESRLLRVFKT